MSILSRLPNKEILSQMCSEEIFSLVLPDRVLDAREYREWIVDVEEVLEATGRASKYDSEENGMKWTHTFLPGIYVREIFMPAGILVTSQIHMFEHPFVVTKGELTVYDGKSFTHIKAPYKGITTPGTKRILYIHEDTVWTTYHPSDVTCLEDVNEEGRITCKTYESFDKHYHKEITL